MRSAPDVIEIQPTHTQQDASSSSSWKPYRTRKMTHCSTEMRFQQPSHSVQGQSQERRLRSCLQQSYRAASGGKEEGDGGLGDASAAPLGCQNALDSALDSDSVNGRCIVGRLLKPMLATGMLSATDEDQRPSRQRTQVSLVGVIATSSSLHQKTRMTEFKLVRCR